MNFNDFLDKGITLKTKIILGITLIIVSIIWLGLLQAFFITTLLIARYIIIKDRYQIIKLRNEISLLKIENETLQKLVNNKTNNVSKRKY